MVYFSLSTSFPPPFYAADSGYSRAQQIVEWTPLLTIMKGIITICPPLSPFEYHDSDQYITSIPLQYSASHLASRVGFVGFRDSECCAETFVHVP